MEQKIISINNADVVHDKKTILHDVSIKIEKGDFIYLIGEVGSGKTSLLKLLYAEIPLKKGDGFVLNYALNNLQKSKRPYLRRELGFIFQDFRLLNDRTVYENYRFVLKATGWNKRTKIDTRIKEVLGIVRMSEKEKEMPQNLSGGEQQQIALGRALLNNPPIILADEPTGHLDPQSTERLMNTLSEIHQQGKTVVMATHNYDVIKKYPHRILECKDEHVQEKSF